MQPFSPKNLLVVFFGFIAVATVWYLPSTGYPLLNIIIRTGLFAAVFAFLVIRFQVSEDINDLWSRRRESLRDLLGF